MKIRTGFVTNSSSSSFVLCFKDDESIETFKANVVSAIKGCAAYLKSNKEHYYDEYDECTDFDEFDEEDDDDAQIKQGWLYKRIVETIENHLESDTPKKVINDIEGELEYSNGYLPVNIQELKKVAKSKQKLIKVEFDDHEDGYAESIMYDLIDGDIVLTSFNHH